MNQKLLNRLNNAVLQLFQELPFDDQRKVGMALIDNLTEICVPKNSPRNRRGWKTLEVQIPQYCLDEYGKLAKNEEMKLHQFIRWAMYVAARNIRRTGDIFGDTPVYSQASSLLPDARCLKCCRGTN